MPRPLALLLALSGLACVDLTVPPGLAGLADAAGMETGTPGDAPASQDAPGDGPGMLSDGPDGPAPDAPLLSNGRPCTQSGACESGFCVDGVCCQTACTDACYACNLRGWTGNCAPVPAGEDPGDECALEAPATCGRDGTCNGIGGCRLYTAGTACAAASCTGATESSARTCDGLGTCRPGTTKSCLPYMCGQEGCATSCMGKADCAGTSTCEMGRCSGLQPAGLTCTTGAECASGFCVDGVCCQTTCGEACHACNVAGSLGTCAPVGAGEDPDDDCPTETAETCGKDGSCDGRGGCRLYATGTTCGPATCAAGVETPARTCDGAGTCRPGVARSCAPFACAGDTCATACAMDGDCGAGHFCDVNTCRPKLVLGAGCAGASQCASGFCADGVCCDTACESACHACNLTGGGGTCKPVPAGQDPREDCAPEAAATCGRDGTCNGAGACRLHAEGIACAPQSCAAGIETSARTCDGAGTCRPATTRACAPNVCAGDACAMSCTSQADCAAGSYCDGTNCRARQGNGTACTMATQCTTGFCIDGVCCDTACTGTCQACNVAGSVGACTAVPAGQDPRDDCAPQDASTCGRDGACNGSGGCRLHPVGTTCVVGSCSAATETSARTCDGAGTCRAATTRSCAPYACSGAACGSMCSSPSQCAAGYTCSGVTCVPK